MANGNRRHTRTELVHHGLKPERVRFGSKADIITVAQKGPLLAISGLYGVAYYIQISQLLAGGSAALTAG